MYLHNPMIEYQKVAKDVDTITQEIRLLVPRVSRVSVKDGNLIFDVDDVLQDVEIDLLLSYNMNTFAIRKVPTKAPPEVPYIPPPPPPDGEIP